MKRKTRKFLLISVALLGLPLASFAQPRMVSIGDRRLSIDCDGKAGRSATVVLIAGAGRTAADWARVQPAVSSFARVCSYDRAGFGQSDKAAVRLQSVEEVVDDLHALIKASGEKGPFILVAHSIAGIYVRRFVTKYPGETAGLVFVDSSHEEQALRRHELDPKGPGMDDVTSSRFGFYVKPGERLEWRTTLPLIVIARGKPTPRTARDGSDSQNNRMTEDQFAEWDRIWRGFQEDLAKRSTHGEFRLAEQSGHFIQQDQPDLVIDAIKQVVGLATLKGERLRGTHSPMLAFSYPPQTGTVK